MTAYDRRSQAVAIPLRKPVVLRNIFGTARFRSRKRMKLSVMANYFVTWGHQMTTIEASRFRSIGDRIRETGGFTSGFDYMRIVLSVLVVLTHSLRFSGDESGRAIVFPGMIDDIRGPGVLAVFFCLSGFLVAASLIRTASLKVFLGLRALRIAPALCVEIVLSALLLGPILTAVSLREYFTSAELFRYFLNIFGWIHYTLPGVFLNNAIPGLVNGSLWTVPYEAECYIALALLSLFGLTKYPRAFLIAFIVLSIALCAYALTHADPDPHLQTATGRQLVLFFLGGVLLYLHRDRAPWSGWLALVAAAVSAMLVQSHSLIYLAPLPVAYITAYLGLLTPRKLPIIFTGDYSYGIYLYAGPMQQAAYQLTPIGHTWYGNFAVAMITVSCFAAFSWHAIEKPALRLKRHIIERTNRNRSSSDELIAPDKTRLAVAEGGDGAQPLPAPPRLQG